MLFSNADPRDDSVQVVDGVIDVLLIDNAVKSLGAESVTEGIYTELKWTDACEDLLRTYREKIHSSVCSASNGEFYSADTLYRSLIDRRLPISLNPTQKRNERSSLLRVLTLAFRKFLSAGSVFLQIIILLFPSFRRGYQRGRRAGLQIYARKYYGGRGPWSVLKEGQTLSALKTEGEYTL